MSTVNFRIIISLLLFFASYSNQLVQAQNFTVVGTKIYDPEGKEFVAQGTNVTGKGSLWSNTTIADKDKIINCWNFNTIRLYYKLYTNSTVTEQDFYDVIDEFSAEKIVVIVDVHDNIGGYFEGEELADLKSFWRDFAIKYKDNPYVWFDIHNEPGNGSLDTRWITQHQEVIKVIRDEVRADNIIIVEGGAWGQDAPDRGTGNVPESSSMLLTYGDQVKTFNNTTYENIVLSLHIYDQYKNGTSDRIINYIDAIWAKGHALIIGEWGNHNNNDVSAAMHAFAGVLPERDVGRVVWHWEGGDNNKLTTSRRGSDINSCTDPTNLTQLGTYVWNDNHTDPFDTVPPANASNLEVFAKTSVSFDISWDAPADNDVKGYYIYIDGEIKDTVTATTYTVGDLQPATDYLVGIEVFDIKYNVSERAEWTVTTLEPDVVNPETPQNVTIEQVKTEEFTVKFSPSTDDQGVKHYNLYFNNVLEISLTDTFYTFTGLQPGINYNLTIDAEDLSGNKSTPTEVIPVETFNTGDYAFINNSKEGDGLYQFNFNGDSWRIRNNAPGRYMNDESYVFVSGSQVELKFIGTKVMLYGTRDPNFGKAEVRIDNEPAGIVDYYSEKQIFKELLFASDELEKIEHTLTLTSTEIKQITLDWGEVICVGCEITDVKTIVRGDIKVYPVPASDYVVIELPGYHQFVSYSILNAQGKVIRSQSHSNDHRVYFDVVGLNAGIYFIQIIDGQNRVISHTLPIIE
jgi:mannan endo-1,4-beta-mannosidase